MKLQDLLEGSARKRKLTVSQAAMLAQAHCSDALKFKETPIVRGMTGSFCHLIHGELGERSSRHGMGNYYTVILDEILGKLGYPLRAKSTICETWAGRKTIAGYGDELFVLLPFNGVKIGVCPKNDIWNTPIKLGTVETTLYRLNDYLEALKIPDSSFSEIIKGIEHALQHSYDSSVKKMFGHDTVINVLKDAHSPDKLGMTLTTTKNPTFNGTAHELWFSGECIAMPYEDYADWFLRGEHHED